MEDGFSPPQASRVYVYPHIGFYSCLQSFYPDSLFSLDKIITNSPSIPQPNKIADPILSSILTFLKISKSLVFSEELVSRKYDEMILQATKNNFSENEINESKKFADSVSSTIIAWIKKDHYQQTRTLERFTSSKLENEWRETPPDYSQGLEPHWPKLRRFYTDSTMSFISVPPPSYSKLKDSEFFKEAIGVYEISKKLTNDEKEIALYWDDNPNVSSHNAHLSHITHKISPPGHWLNIISQIFNEKNYSLFEMSKTFTLTAIAMYEGIIDCWKLKYKTQVIRPISFIHEQIDPEWKPLIQTPPFPEYTSGHSVISAAAAEILTYTLGESYSFTDSTEVLFGNGVRTFKNFHEAAMEVSLSRYFAGIHYKNSVLNGNIQGINIAKNLIQKLPK